MVISSRRGKRSGNKTDLRTTMPFAVGGICGATQNATPEMVDVLISYAMNRFYNV